MAGNMICTRTTLTLLEFAETYFTLRLISNPKTLEIYRLAVKHWAGIHPALSIAQIDRMAIARFQQVMGAGRSPASVNAYTRPIMAMLRLAAEDDVALIEHPPKATKLREPTRVPLALTVDEFRQVLAAAKRWPWPIAGYPAADWWPAVLFTGWETGLRATGLFASRTVDLLWDDKGLLSQPEPQKDREGLWFPLQSATLRAIRRVYDPNRELLFPLDVQAARVGKWFRKILDSSGIYAPKGAGMRFHRLRRSKASYTEAAGGDATRALGHSARSVTERYLDPRIVGRAKQPPMPIPV